MNYSLLGFSNGANDFTNIRFVASGIVGFLAVLMNYSPCRIYEHSLSSFSSSTI